MEFVDFMLCLLSPGSPKADVGWSVNWSTYSIASCVRNISATNYYNQLVFVQVMIDKVADGFFILSVYFNTYFAWSAFSR